MTRVEIDVLLRLLGSELKEDAEITICGGTSIVLDAGYRDSTSDIDCIDCSNKILVLADDIRVSKNLDRGWINTDVTVTSSYSENLIKWRKPYKKFGNLMVYVISGIALLCMKLKSFRSDSNDFEDAQSIIKDCIMMGYGYKDVQEALLDIYPSDASISVDAERFLKDSFMLSEYMLDEESIQSYVTMVKDGVIKLSEIPEEFVDQVRYRIVPERNEDLYKRAMRIMADM